jgi:hypothetical protein
MRLKKLLPVAVGGGLGGPILIFVLIMVFYPNLLLSGIIQKKLETEFGGKVEAEKVFFGWKNGIEISNLFIKNEEYEKPILKVDSVYLKFAIVPFLKNKLIIQRLVVNRPEMVIYRGEPDGQKGPSLDGAPELERAHTRKRDSTGFSRGKHPFPEIIEAVINNGTFIFTDLSSGESTKLENFNVTLTGLRPGGTVQINGECDIIGGGGQDHAVISGDARGFDSAGLTTLAGKLIFKSGFVDAQAAVDMSGLTNPGTRILAVSIYGDLQKTVTSLGAVLMLPKDSETRGVIDSKTSAVSQPDGSMVMEGKTSASDLYLKLPFYLAEPVSLSQSALSYQVDISPMEMSADIKKFVFNADDTNLDLSGIVYSDGTVNAEVHLSALLEEVMVKLACFCKPPDKVNLAGYLTSDMNVSGILGKTVTLKGTSRIKDLGLEFKSHRYTDPEVKIYHDLDYDQENAAIGIKKMESTLGLLALNLTQGLVKLGENGHYQGKLNLISDMEEVNKFLDLPKTISLKKTGTVNLDFKGYITYPFYNNLTARGTIGVDEVIYENYAVTDIKVKNLTLENNRLNTSLDMLVNGAPANAVFNANLADGPHIEAELHAANVPVTQVLKRGTISGLVTLNINKAQGKGIDWDKRLKKTLIATGDIKLENGSLSSSELVVSLLKHFGQQGNAYHIESLTTDFDVHDQTLYTPKSQKFMVVGAPFDMELSGSMGFNGQLDYLATVFIPKENVGKDLQGIFGAMQNNPKITLKITGNLSEPKVGIAGDAMLENLLDVKQTFKDVESIFKDIFK